MGFKGTNYENKDLRKQTEDIIDNLNTSLLEIASRLRSQNENNVSDLLDTIKDKSVALPFIASNTLPVLNGQLETELIVEANLTDLKASYDSWRNSNQSAVIVSVVPVQSATESGLLITYYP